MGGAAIATKRLMQALRSDGLDATMLVRDKTSADPHVVALPGRFQQRFNFFAERAGVWAANGFRRRNLFVVDTAAFGTNILRQTLVQEADVVHLNWINQGMMSLASVAQLLKAGKKVVWTLHDMWPLTGICHHAEDCRGWLASCGNCPKLLRPAAQDLSRQTFEKKMLTYGSARLKIVACSNWLADLARQAPLLQASEVFSVPNAIDTQFFSPGSKAEARAALGLPQDKRLILFVAYRVTDEKKGIQHLIEAANRLMATQPERKADWGVVLAGREAAIAAERFPCAVYPQAYISQAEQMRLLYRAADVLAMPTLMDNLPNTIAEGMACGLPCVGFRVGGLPQMVDDALNGYLVPLADAEALARRLFDVLTTSSYPQLSLNARRKAESNYGAARVAARYRAIYETI